VGDMTETYNKGWTVTLAATGINLALGINHAWSIFKESIFISIKTHDGRFTWDLANLNDPYAICCLSIAFAMIIAGRLQDKFGPRVVAFIGGILTGMGLICSALSYSLVFWVLGFGVLTGMGIGCGFASATPASIKWFPASKTGFITGIVVGGFGLAPVYIAPLAQFFIGRFSLNVSMIIFGITFAVVVCSLAQLLVNPPPNYNPNGLPSRLNVPINTVDFTPLDMLKTTIFYKLWIMYVFSAGATLMIIGNLVGMAKQSLGSMAWLSVTLMAFGNASGRFLAGFISDKIGRPNTMFLMMGIGGVVMFGLFLFGESNTIFIITAAVMVGFDYGTNLSLFPAAAKDYFGIKNFGINYGLLITGWGLGGFILPQVSQKIMAYSGSYKLSYLVAGVLLTISSILSLLTKKSSYKF